MMKLWSMPAPQFYFTVKDCLISFEVCDSPDFRKKRPIFAKLLILTDVTL